jgi:serine/threonine protein kinase
MDVSTHEKLGNYRLVRRLATGGFSTVYLGEHLHLKTPAAIKVLHSRLFSDEALASFMQEARLVEQLHHAHIVRMLDFGVEEHAPYLVFQYAPHGMVRQRYPKGARVPLPIIVQYVRQIAEALQYAHDLKIIHRDIKPENFLLDKNDEILLGDFGLAIPSRSSVGMLDRERAGTAAYMAPEQALGKSSRASDQYALGIVVYEWLCGYPPFKGADHEILHHHIHDTPAPLHELVPEIPVAIEQVVMRALAKEPSERFPQIQDFARALAAAYYDSLAQQAGAALALPPSPALEPSSPGRKAVNAPSQDQPQPQSDDEIPARHNNSHGPRQQVAPASKTGFLAAPVSPNERTVIDPDAPTQGLTAVVSPAKQKRRMSRRSMLAASILGLAFLGGGSAAAWYLLGSSNSMPGLRTLSRARTAPARTAANTPGGGTSNAGGTGPNANSTNSPSPAARARATATTAPMAPLTVRISNIGALAQVRINSTDNVVVTTSQPGIPAMVQVTYSDGTMQTLGLQTTDGNGNATFAWHVHSNTGLGKLRNLSATLVASATGMNGQTVSSAPVIAIILL